MTQSTRKTNALDARTLLAYEMNGETLPVKHGFPMRVVAPGWAGDCWIKWLTSISFSTKHTTGSGWRARTDIQAGRLSPERLSLLNGCSQ